MSSDHVLEARVYADNLELSSGAPQIIPFAEQAVKDFCLSLDVDLAIKKS